MYIHFQKIRFLVPIKHIFKYIRWSWFVTKTQQNRFRKLLISIWKPVVRFNVNHEVELAVNSCKALDVHVGWIRFPTDGTRLQVFDTYNTQICKLAKQKSGFQSLELELKRRDGLGELSPAIKRIDANHAAYIEEWVNNGNNGHCTLEELEITISLLLDKFYKIQWVNLDEYFQLTHIEYTAEASKLMSKVISIIGWDKVPVSPVHGDLVCQNMLFKNDKPILIDWEYARICMVSYDLWIYLYHRAKSSKKNSEESLSKSFFSELNKMLGHLGLIVDNVNAVHLFHLLEREALLNHNSDVVQSNIALEIMRLEITRISKEFGLEY